MFARFVVLVDIGSLRVDIIFSSITGIAFFNYRKKNCQKLTCDDYANAKYIADAKVSRKMAGKSD